MKKQDNKKYEDKTVEMAECIRCGVKAPIGFFDDGKSMYEFILPNEKIPLCCNCIEYLAAKLEEMTAESYSSNAVVGNEIDINGIKIRVVSESKSTEEENTMKTKPIVTKIMEIKKLEKEVLKYIIGQDEHVRNIITAIYKGRIFPEMKSNILIVGKSGTGKTETIKQIAKLLDMPYTIEDATQYTEEGYCGASVKDMIANLIDNAGGDMEKASRGMLIIDEIDKKATSGEMIGRDVSGQAVIKSLLKIIEGTNIKYSPDGYEEYDFDTSNLIVVFMGAFQGLDEIRKKRMKKSQIGFSTCENDCNENNEHDKIMEKDFIKQDFIKYGFTEEFMGRINNIEEMNTLTVQNLATIIRKSKLSEFKKHKDRLKSRGIRLVYPKEIPEIIAKEALQLDTGAREISNVVNKMFEKIIYEVIAEPKKYTSCKITKETAKDNSKFLLE